ncbi:unnamed protein product [Heligmosomoides polygyrus]|uniref:Uncharacterized protein n=1 Tax=Heligmosomoides polygyrus TaxID=6339 RepID=A0A183FUD1_HELPZ|nr:unnamed protein product [Heligmosomoides polygyrus]
MRFSIIRTWRRERNPVEDSLADYAPRVLTSHSVVRMNPLTARGDKLSVPGAQGGMVHMEGYSAPRLRLSTSASFPCTDESRDVQVTTSA